MTQNGAVNRFFYRLPEVSFTYNPMVWDYRVNQKMTLGRYQEVEYFSQSSTARTFPTNEDMGLGPNTFGFSQSISRDFAYLPNSVLSLSSGYNQMVFQTPHYGWFSGDAFYTLDMTLHNQSNCLGFLLLDTTFVDAYAPNDNTSPFFYFNEKLQAQNALNQKISLYWNKPEQYVWSHETGYDWISNRWRDYITRIFAQPVPFFSCAVSTGKKLNPSASELPFQYYPLIVTLTVLPVPPSPLNLFYDVAFDTNQWMATRKWVVQNSRFSFNFNVGEDPLNRWELGSSFVYNAASAQQEFSFDRYELQLFQAVKRDHCRTFTFGYNKSLEEFQFKMTIDAFPEDPIELVRTRDLWRFGGRLNQAAQERF